MFAVVSDCPSRGQTSSEDGAVPADLDRVLHRLNGEQPRHAIAHLLKRAIGGLHDRTQVVDRAVYDHRRDRTLACATAGGNDTLRLVAVADRVEEINLRDDEAGNRMSSCRKRCSTSSSHERQRSTGGIAPRSKELVRGADNSASRAASRVKANTRATPDAAGRGLKLDGAGRAGWAMR